MQIEQASGQHMRAGQSVNLKGLAVSVFARAQACGKSSVPELIGPYTTPGGRVRNFIAAKATIINQFTECDFRSNASHRLRENTRSCRLFRDD